MKKTKKFLSILLSLAMATIIAFGGASTAFAYDVYEIEPNNDGTSLCSFRYYNDVRLYESMGGNLSTDRDLDFFRFQILEPKRITLSFKHELESYGGWIVTLFKVENSRYWKYDDVYVFSPEGTKVINYNLTEGNYMVRIDAADYYGYPVNLEYEFLLSETIDKPTTFKVSTRNTTSLKLSWGKAGNVSGYQLQRKSGDTYKTIANTTATSYTVTDLASATNYSFRVRAYKTVDGKKYYSSWKTLSTPTKPAKVSIKTPATNSKHEIIAKWNKITRASGYQVQYCKNKSCSSVIATKTVSGQSKVSYTGKNFTKNKTYYVRVRAYKTVNGTKYYGAWSSVKAIKCK